MLHLGHMEYLLEAKKLCKHLVIGISNPDPGVIKFDEACPHRSLDTANPLTYYERLEMIVGAMTEAGVDRSEVSYFLLMPSFLSPVYVAGHIRKLIIRFRELHQH